MYEQNVPLYKALSYGASSVEADIYLVDDELLVGHTPFDLSKTRTLASLYLDPLMSLIETANKQAAVGTTRGIFELAPSITLNLLIDIKTDGPSTFKKLYNALDPLRTAGYLSTWDPTTSSIKRSIITVIGTGNTPLESVQTTGNDRRRPRDIFLDAPLAKLPGDKANVYNQSNSPLASIDFGSGVGLWYMLPPVGRRRIRMLAEAAHAKGIQARFWNTPIAPIWLRNYVWQMLLDEGVDWLNVDDLPAAKDF
ncbi:hypothetical protein HWV62_27427 [Athelia sp. TMB]|nr:hypothetical protein HWV62_37571 [Athelia sp. TMB]KAF7969384.1 hypothetical protein HWV62_27427 [Athelia sp. TMB]